MGLVLRILHQLPQKRTRAQGRLRQEGTGLAIERGAQSEQIACTIQNECGHSHSINLHEDKILCPLCLVHPAEEGGRCKEQDDCQY